MLSLAALILKGLRTGLPNKTACSYMWLLGAESVVNQTEMCCVLTHWLPKTLHTHMR